YAIALASAGTLAEGLQPVNNSFWRHLFGARGGRIGGITRGGDHPLRSNTPMSSNTAGGGLLVLTFLLAGGAHAQWLNFPAPGAPRTPNGKVDLNAPAPKDPSGKPDLSGVWMHATT